MENVSESEIWDFINDSLAMQWDDLFANFANSKNANKHSEITGSLGLWYGNPSIEHFVFVNIERAVQIY